MFGSRRRHNDRAGVDSHVTGRGHLGIIKHDKDVVVRPDPEERRVPSPGRPKMKLDRVALGVGVLAAPDLQRHQWVGWGGQGPQTQGEGRLDAESTALAAPLNMERLVGWLVGRRLEPAGEGSRSRQALLGLERAPRGWG